MDNLEQGIEKEGHDKRQSEIMGYMARQLKKCPKCSESQELCSDCRIELNRKIELSDRHAWLEQLRYTEVSPDPAHYGPWLSEELSHALSVCAYNALHNGIPMEIAIAQNFKIQWIQTELSRIGFKPDSPAPTFDRIKWNDNAALLSYLIHQLYEKGYITPPQRNGTPNWTALARSLFAVVEIVKENKDPVTEQSFIQAMKPGGDVTENKRGPHAFKIYKRG